VVALTEEEWLTDYTKLLISEHWKPCGLDGWLLKQLRELMEEEIKRGRRWLRMRAQYAVEWYTNLAIANARKYGGGNVEEKKCYYFNKALKEKLIPKYYLSLGV